MKRADSSAVSVCSVSISSRLAAFALETRWQDLSTMVQQEAVRTFLNWVGCAVGGARTPSAEAAIRGRADDRHSGAACALSWRGAGAERRGGGAHYLFHLNGTRRLRP